MLNPLVRLQTRGGQIDRLVARFTGQGSRITSHFRLPRARYTIFVMYDAGNAVCAFALTDKGGRSWPDWQDLPSPGDVRTPLVQEALPSSTYRIEIETALDSCGWDVQVVLNSMQSWAAAPPTWTPSKAPPSSASILSTGAHTLTVEQTGQYLVDWWLGERSGGLIAAHRHQYTLRLRGTDGQEVELGAGDGGRDRRIDRAFLGAGEWAIDMKSDAPWELTITPVVGPMGGGARGF